MSDGKRALGPSLGEAARNADRACDAEDPAGFFESIFDGAMWVCGDALMTYLSLPDEKARPEELAEIALGLMMSYCGFEEGFRDVVRRLCKYLSRVSGVRQRDRAKGLPEAPSDYGN